MSIDTAAVGGGTPCPRDLGGEDMSAGGGRALYRIASGFTKQGEEGHNGEQVGIESGEGDDEREGHSSSILSRHRPRSLHADASVIDLGLGMEPNWTFAVDLC